MPQPTREQQAIVDAYRAGGDIVVEAGAGTGKTSTTRMLAAATPHRRGVYIAFNRATAGDARRSFPDGVYCATAHALAMRAIGRNYKHKLNGPRQPARETARLLGIHRPLHLSDTRVLQPAQIARAVMDAVTRFCYSADPQITAAHLPRLPGLDDSATVEALTDRVLPLARRAWADITSPDGRLRFEHDHYLKMWQLSGPRFPVDYLLLDEAQDTNPVLARIIDQQTHVQRVAIGDESQSIYGWRGATSAMVGFAADRRLPLSQSFRFGPAVATEANKWLTLLGARLRLSGLDSIPSVVDTVSAPDAVLCRSNAEAIAQIMAAPEGQAVALVGGGSDIRRLAEAATTLKAGAGTSHPELYAFRSWAEVQDHVEQDNAGQDLKVFVQLIDQHGPEEIIAAADGLVPEDRADLVVSTAHRSKGREWSAVRVAGDFREPDPMEGELEPEELRLAYVAVTRARRALDRGGLVWVDRWVRARGHRPSAAA